MDEQYRVGDHWRHQAWADDEEDSIIHEVLADGALWMIESNGFIWKTWPGTLCAKCGYYRVPLTAKPPPGWEGWTMKEKE